MTHSYTPSPATENPPCKYTEPGMHAFKPGEGSAEHEPQGGTCQHRIGGVVCGAHVYMKPSTIPSFAGVKFPSIADNGPQCLVALSRDVDF